MQRRIDMTLLNLNYGDTSFPMDIDGQHVKVIASKNIVQTNTELELLKYAIEHPIDSPRLKDFLLPHENVVIIIPDVTRLWQKPSVYLPVLIEEIKSAGLSDQQIHFISALGTHRKQTKKEHRALLGDTLYQRFEIIDHNCKDSSNLSYVGTTSFGTEVFINALALSFDHMILTGGIVFHDLAGFGGGRKVLVPGIAGYKTIMQNHAHSLNPQGSGINPLIGGNQMQTNPFHLDLMEAAAFVKPSFLFNVLLDDDGKIMHAVAGDYVTAHQAGCDFLRTIDLVKIQEKAEVVVASAGGYPKDMNFYQATKALCNAFHACKKGGDIILLACCEEGLGHPEMEKIFKDFETNNEREHHVRKNYTIAKFFAYLTCVWAKEFNLHLVSSLNKAEMKHIGIDVYDNLDDALHVVQQRYDGAYKVFVMPSAASTLPELTGE
ncbi:MAG: nickel-dependent lactate racemase [Erysipelotrichales bacterium]|nr:MAG: nickel-dependent lactate racemase [Erysipelotrichales bacterium]